MSDEQKKTVTMLAGGDIMIGEERGPLLKTVDQIADLVLPTLRQADLRFGQCEWVYSKRGWPEFGSHGRLDPELASIWETAGIDVISMASNHTMDWGPDALLDTVELFRKMGKHPFGAGKDGKEAREPAIVECRGVKIAFLGYCTVLRPGHQADENKPGCAPMRAHTSYLTVDWQAGAPPRIITTPHEEDLKLLQEDIRKAKQQADAVVMSIHWGLHHMPKTICDYQPIVAHAAIDAGADLILGHHPHCIKAVEVYKGKVCFYSIGNFMTTGAVEHANIASLAHRNKWNLWWFNVKPECLPPQGMFYFPDDNRLTMMVKVIFGKNGVDRVSFLPTYINGQGQPAVVPSSDPKFQEILDFTEWASDCHPHRFHVEENEVVVTA